MTHRCVTVTTLLPDGVTGSNPIRGGTVFLSCHNDIYLIFICHPIQPDGSLLPWPVGLCEAATKSWSLLGFQRPRRILCSALGSGRWTYQCGWVCTLQWSPCESCGTLHSGHHWVLNTDTLHSPSNTNSLVSVRMYMYMQTTLELNYKTPNYTGQKDTSYWCPLKRNNPNPNYTEQKDRSYWCPLKREEEGSQLYCTLDPRLITMGCPLILIAGLVVVSTRDCGSVSVSIALWYCRYSCIKYFLCHSADFIDFYQYLTGEQSSH